MLADYDSTHTEIYTDCSYVVNEDDICTCENYYNQSSDDDCDCPRDPRVTWSGIMLRVPQKPIKTAPMDSMYNIRVFDEETHESMSGDVLSLFVEENMTHEFSIMSTISRESDETYVHLLKHLFNTGKFISMKDYSYGFSGKAAKSEYVKAFMSIAQNMINNYDANIADVKNVENAHVDRRKKINVPKMRKGKIKK